MEKYSKSQEVEERVIDIANFILEAETTIRATALEYKVSKSTVAKDLKKRLPKINPELAIQVQELLDDNKKMASYYGGMATKMKYSGGIKSE